MQATKFISPILVVLVLFSCASGPIDIPQELTTAELIQRGQEASDRNRYDQALQYYEAILERYSYDIDSVCAAEYEIAFIHYKQKKYEQSREEFNTLLSRYDTPDAELLPQQFKILSEIVIKRMDDQGVGLPKAVTGEE